MSIFEGYVGIRLWDGQLVDDIVFLLLFVLLSMFAIVFRSNSTLFVKMIKDAFLVRERDTLFDDSMNKNEWFFRNFMISQALFLSTIAAYAMGRIYGYLNLTSAVNVLFSLAAIFGVIFIFYQFRQFLNFILGKVFADKKQYEFWKTNYNAIIGTWGVMLYIPVLWLIFVGEKQTIPVIMFFILYILCRIVIIYKTIRIFYNKNAGILYLSLYLCAQEILPLVFLYEGTVYLYNFIETSTLWH